MACGSCKKKRDSEGSHSPGSAIKNISKTAIIKAVESVSKMTEADQQTIQLIKDKISVYAGFNVF